MNDWKQVSLDNAFHTPMDSSRAIKSIYTATQYSVVLHENLRTWTTWACAETKHKGRVQRRVNNVALIMNYQYSPSRRVMGSSRIMNSSRCGCHAFLFQLVQYETRSVQITNDEESLAMLLSGHARFIRRNQQRTKRQRHRMICEIDLGLPKDVVDACSV